MQEHRINTIDLRLMGAVWARIAHPNGKRMSKANKRVLATALGSARAIPVTALSQSDAKSLFVQQSADERQCDAQ
jgi:hypothetical protein